MTRTENEDEQYKNVDWIARDSDGMVQRRTIVQGAAWTIPVVAVAVGAPLAAASTTDPVFDVVPIGRPAPNTTVVRRNQTPRADFMYQNNGPDVAPLVRVAVRIPSIYNDPGRTATIINNGGTAPWSGSASYQDGGYDVYVFSLVNMPVGQTTLSFYHAVNGAAPTPGSYEIEAVLQVNDSNPGNNGGWRSTGTISVV